MFDLERRNRWRVGAGATALAVALGGTLGCENSGADRIVNIGPRGVVKGFVYFDANGSRSLDGADGGQPGVRVFVLPRGSRDTVARATSDINGNYRVAGVPVGDYVVIVDSATAGDTARIVRVDFDTFTLRPFDSVTTEIGVSYPAATVAELRLLTSGRRVFVNGVALNSQTTFGDSTLHLADATGFIRVTRVPLTQVVLIADSIRLLGTRAARDGQPTLDNVGVFFLGLGSARTPEPVTTAAAAAADGERLDAALVRVSDATIGDTATIDRPAPFPDDFEVTADDGTGPLVIVFDGDAGLGASGATGYVPGVVLSVTGVLVPTGSGTWRLKPRVLSDVTCPACSVAGTQQSSR